MEAVSVQDVQNPNARKGNILPKKKYFEGRRLEREPPLSLGCGPVSHFTRCIERSATGIKPVYQVVQIGGTAAG
jgi:hypothetical protein